MTIVNWKAALFSLEGRLSINQFWKYGFLNAVFVFGIMLLVHIFISKHLHIIFFLLANAYLLWVSVAIIVKRLHDQNKSAIKYLFYLIPIIGPIWCLIECGCMGGGVPAVNPNKYGPPPEVPIANWPKIWKEKWPEYLT